MSSYMYFFIRKHDEFIPISYYNSNSLIYNIFQPFAPDKAIEAITREDLICLESEIESKIDKYKIEQDSIEKRLKLIGTFNNSVAEKAAAIEKDESRMRELDRCLDKTNVASNFIRFLFDMTHTIDIYSISECIFIDPDEYIYVGIQCGPAVDVSTIAK